MTKILIIMAICFVGRWATAQSGLWTVDGRPYQTPATKMIGQLHVGDQMVVRATIHLGEVSTLRVLIEGGHSICNLVGLKEIQLRKGETFEIYRITYDQGHFSIYLRNELMEPSLLVTCGDYVNGDTRIRASCSVSPHILNNVYGLQFN